LSPLKRSNNFAARMGRWSASHWKTAVFGWLAFVFVAVGIGTAVGTQKLDPIDAGTGDSGEAYKILDSDFKQNVGEQVLVESDELIADAAAFRAVVDDVIRRLDSKAIVTDIQSPYAPANAGQISEDRHSVLIDFDLRETEIDDAMNMVDPILDTTEGAQAAHSGFTIEQFGDASAGKQLDESFMKDLEKAGVLSIPITLVILLAAFGALVAAGIPLLLGLTAVIATMGLLSLPSQLVGLDDTIGAIVLLIGLAVGVDYTMFYLKRWREEREAGRKETAALEAAAATSGRAVLISGLTVMVAMAGLFFTGQATFFGFGLATIMVVAVAVLGSLTVLPALLSRLGDKVNKGRIPLGRRFFRRKGEGALWGAILDRVLKRPLVSVIVSAGLLIALAAPALNMHTYMPGPETYPRSIPVMKTYDKIQDAFPGEVIAAQVVVKADDVRTPAVQKSIKRMEKQALATGRIHQPIDESVNEQGTVAVISMAIDGQGTDSASNRSLDTLRNEVIPATLDKQESIEFAGVGGTTADSRDFNDQMKHAAPFVFLFVLAFAFALLLVTFRSVVIAAKAIVLNLLSVAAAYGVLVLVFQHGFGKELLGFDYTGGVVAFLPIFLFVILFGLSMDYHVFILSRVREAFDRGMKTEDAVTYGIKSTAAVVTSAAMVMVFVFGVFATLSMIMFKQFGVGLAVAVLIDATIVRAVLLPAAMKLLGDWNWYLPRWLEWLPQVKHEGEAAQDGPAPRPQPAFEPTGS
jgi:uncharacterized membrane protein YdfJ with MMPL/SSD domain